MTGAPAGEEVRRVLESAELLYDRAEVEAALDRMATAIEQRLAGREPVVLCVMNGGLVPTGRILPRLGMPLRLDYIHATRYRGGTAGGTLEWLREPRLELAGQTVLVVDDILDQGLTLKAIVEACRGRGAREVFTAVLVEKVLAQRPGLAQADFTALTVPDRYVFGYGMDYHEYLRNAPGIYAVAARCE